MADVAAWGDLNCKCIQRDSEEKEADSTYRDWDCFHELGITRLWGFSVLQGSRMCKVHIGEHEEQ